METVGDRKFVEITGSKTHELPPLLVHPPPVKRQLDKVLAMANNIIDSEDMLAEIPSEQLTQDDADKRRMSIALNLVDQYYGFVTLWQWGDSILEWIRQCEITFEARLELRHLLKNNVWPHAGRSSFVELLQHKNICAKGVKIESAVGTRLVFLKPPKIDCLSDQFLFYLNLKLGSDAYSQWSAMTPNPIASLPPERFSFQVVTMDLSV